MVTSGQKSMSIELLLSLKFVIMSVRSWLLIAASFGVNVNGGAMVAAESGCKGSAFSRINFQFHRATLLTPYCTSFRKASDNSHDLVLHFLEMRFSPSFLVQSWHTKCNARSGKV